MESLIALLATPEAWLALLTLVLLEIVLGIDNLIFISILTNKLPEDQRARARFIGISAALILRLVLLSLLVFIVGLTKPVFELFDHAFSWRDIILVAGGLFLLWKATMEIHEQVALDDEEEEAKPLTGSFGAGLIIVQILALDLVFSVDSILTAVGMTQDLPIMATAVIISVLVMLVAARPLADFIEANPSIVMLALGFLLMIGMVLIADGFGVHVPKGFVYSAVGFSILIEALNMMARRARKRRRLKNSGMGG